MPRIENKIDLGTVLQIVLLLVGFGVGYGTLKADITSIDRNGTQVTKSLRDDIAHLSTTVAVLTEAVNSLKEQLVLERQERNRLTEQLQSMQKK